MHDEMMALYQRRDRLAYFKCNQQIHSGIVTASGNPVLAEMHEQLQSRIKRVRSWATTSPIAGRVPWPSMRKCVPPGGRATASVSPASSASISTGP